MVYLEKNNEFAVLSVTSDVVMEEMEDGNTHVHLVVHTQYHTHAHVLTNIRPVQIVPETLSDPVLTYLRYNSTLLTAFTV